MGRLAAAVIVMQGSRILAFERFDKPGLSLPCGHVEPGETPRDAAIREALEETGLQVAIDGTKPVFIGFDSVGRKLVYTYRAEVVSGDLKGCAEGEGKAQWASVAAVCGGPFWHYNQRAFQYFDISRPLCGAFHSHITFEAKSSAEASRAASLTSGKLTTIELSRDGRTQTDRMITHHYRTGHHGLEDSTDIVALLCARGELLKTTGFTVSRLKLEYDMILDGSDPAQTDFACRTASYAEVHIKCLLYTEIAGALVAVAKTRGWHPSLNPFAKLDDGRLVQFVNRRFYGEGFDFINQQADAMVRKLEELAQVQEVKYEAAIFDTNEAVDAWWLGKEQAG